MEGDSELTTALGPDAMKVWPTLPNIVYTGSWQVLLTLALEFIIGLPLKMKQRKAESSEKPKQFNGEWRQIFAHETSSLCGSTVSRSRLHVVWKRLRRDLFQKGIYEDLQHQKAKESSTCDQ